MSDELRFRRVAVEEDVREILVKKFNEMLDGMGQYPIYDIAITGDAASDIDTQELSITEKFTRELVEMTDGSYEIEDEEHTIIETVLLECKHK